MNKGIVGKISGKKEKPTPVEVQDGLVVQQLRLVLSVEKMAIGSRIVPGTNQREFSSLLKSKEMFKNFPK